MIQNSDQFTREILRIHLLDILRGVSVLAMVIYHFFWDLGYFQFIELENMTKGFPLLIAQCIGGSFIIISGISSKFASFSENHTMKFLKRLGILVFICSIITSVTFFFDNNSFIFFGILHFLATCSIIGFFLLRLKNSYVLFILFVFSLLLSVSNITFDLPGIFSWLGFNQEVPITNDFYPLFPWISFYFFGLWICEPVTGYLINKNKKVFGNKLNVVHKGLQFLGRNSLTIYILHQPIFFSLFLIFIRISS